MAVRIASVEPGSRAARARIRAGDVLLTINDTEIGDVLDYRFFVPDTRLTLTVSSGGRERRIRIKKDEYEEIGLEFDTYLMDEQRRCRNNCVFCFIDQLPKGMRESLYFKDDDSRLSFLFGNYITLTNLTEHEVERMIRMHISPINISVHTTDPDLRCRMMGNRFAGDCLSILHRFAEAGLTIQCQLVLVPGYNDGVQLDRTLSDLAALGGAIRSVAAVPVGLTKYRDGLTPLRPFTAEESATVIRQLTVAGDRMKQKGGTRVFYPSDEWYIRAGEPFPDASFYDGFPQLENGVGMVALLREQFRAALAEETRTPPALRQVIASGVAAAPILEALVAEAKEKWQGLDVTVVPIRNDFFGENITVSGLVTGGDLMRQLAGVPMERLLLPENMLRHQQDVFLDDVTLEQVRQTLCPAVTLVPETDGEALLAALWQEV